MFCGDSKNGASLHRSLLQFLPGVKCIREGDTFREFSFMSRTRIEIPNCRDDVLHVGKFFRRKTAVTKESAKFDVWELVPQHAEECNNIRDRCHDAQWASFPDFIRLRDYNAIGTRHLDVPLEV